jgi:hypothetical protein
VAPQAPRRVAACESSTERVLVVRPFEGSARSERGALPTFRLVGFRGPPFELDVRLPPHPALLRAAGVLQTGRVGRRANQVLVALRAGALLDADVLIDAGLRRTQQLRGLGYSCTDHPASSDSSKFEPTS